MVSGKSYPEYLKQHLFQPLQMADTYTDRGAQKPKQQASFYETDKKGYFKIWHTFGFPHPDQNLSYKWAGGGLVSTPSDLALMGTALLNDTVMFHQHVREHFFTPHLLAAQ